MIVFSPRAALVRNVIVSGTSGAFTLIILLIAPLGLVAVIINTALVTAACFFTNSMADRVVIYLNPSGNRAQNQFSVSEVNDSDSDALGRPVPSRLDRRS
jgi:hypothetical protein